IPASRISPLRSDGRPGYCCLIHPTIAGCSAATTVPGIRACACSVRMKAATIQACSRACATSLRRGSWRSGMMPIQKEIDVLFEIVMPGLDPGIHVLLTTRKKNVDGRDELGHDGPDASGSSITCPDTSGQPILGCCRSCRCNRGCRPARPRFALRACHLETLKSASVDLVA